MSVVNHGGGAPAGSAGPGGQDRWKTPFAGDAEAPVGENERMITGGWRIVRPVVDTKACTNCLICWIYCPDACIVRFEEYVDVNYKYCKGCGICTRVCPVLCITDVPELDFAD